MNTADLIIKQLEDLGTEYIFGIPGGVLEPLNIAISKSKKIQGITTKHEQGAAFMADGYARVKRTLGVCCSTSGPGATNLLTGVACSYADSIPVLVLTGQVATRSFGKGAFQDSSQEGINVVDIFRCCTKSSSMIVNSELAGTSIRKAMRLALTGRTGPVHLSLPLDVMEAPVNEDIIESDHFIPKSKNFDRENIKKAASILLESSNMVMLLGYGVTLADGAEEAKAIAEMLQIPVATSPKAKGVFPENHPLSIGVFGCAGTPLSEAYLLKHADNGSKMNCILAVGTSFNEWATHSWDERLSKIDNLIHIDVCYKEFGKNYPFATAIIGDAKVALKELSYEIKRQMNETNSNLQGKIDERKVSFNALKEKEPRYLNAESVNSDSSPILPQRLMQDLKESCPENTIFFVDIGNNLAWATHYLEISKPNTFITDLGFASMGYAAAAAIGGKLAAPEEPVVAIVGDGGFLMNGIELATAVNYNIPVIWVILNDSGFGMIDHGKKMLATPGGFSSRFKKVNYVTLASAVGAEGVRISKPGELNEKLMKKIIDSGLPTVIDVQIDQDEIPPIQARVASLETLLP